MAVRIVVDSTVDTLPAYREQMAVVPLTIRFGEEEFIDSVTIDHRGFYEKLIEREEMPTTSQATPADFLQVLTPIVEAGDQAVVITVSSELSGTYQSGVMAAAELGDAVFVVDSRSAAIGSGILAQRGLELVAQGLSARQIAATLTEESHRIRVVALLDTLEYLRRGGRISKTAAVAGTVLSIKPVAGITEGKIRLLGKARGSRQGNNLLVEQIRQAGGVDFSRPVLLGYTGLSDALLQKYIQDSAALWQDASSGLDITPIGSVIGTHVGPGAVAVAFFAGQGQQ